MISTEFEDRLRAEMQHATAGVCAPHGLICKARRGRRRRIMTRTTVATASVTAAAVATAVIVSNGTAGAPRDSRAYTTAFVVRHVESALQGAIEANDIEYVHSTSVSYWFYDGPQGRLSRIESFAAPGQPSRDAVVNVTPEGLATQTVVEFGTKTWWQQSFHQNNNEPLWSTTASCAFSASQVLMTSPAAVVTEIRQALACGALTDEGNENVDGVTAIKLVSVSTGSVTTTTNITETVTETSTVWVDPATYLPVRWAVQASDPRVQDPVTEDIQWLPPTSANLASLTVAIPPGFTQVPPRHHPS